MPSFADTHESANSRADRRAAAPEKPHRLFCPTLFGTRTVCSMIDLLSLFPMICSYLSHREASLLYSGTISFQGVGVSISSRSNLGTVSLGLTQSASVCRRTVSGSIASPTFRKTVLSSCCHNHDAMQV